MLRTILKNRSFWIIVLSIALLVPNFLPFRFIPVPSYGYQKEEYVVFLANRLQSVNAIISYADSIAEKKNISKKNIAYGNIYADIIRKRFYHGYSHYALNENWIAAVVGRFIWDDLSAIVLPDDILKYPSAACSQQSIVMMECFKRIGVPYRKVSFIHHYALEGKFNGEWYFFDTNKEPDFSTIQRKSIDKLEAEGSLYAIYKNSLDSTTFNWALSKHKVENIKDGKAAPNAVLFHKITGFFSRFAWLFTLLLLFIKQKKRKTFHVISTNQKAEVQENQYERSLPVL